MGKNAFDFGDLFLSVVSLLRFTESPHLGMTFAPVSWCLMLLGFGVCPCGSRAVCESKDFCWGGTRNDQAVTDGQEAFCSICKGEMLTLRKVTASVPAVGSLPCIGCWLDWKENL